MKNASVFIVKHLRRGTAAALCAAALFFPVLAQATNMKMVTYFPVPYAAYNDVSVTGTADVGLMNTCALDAGAGLRIVKENSGRALDTGRLIVRHNSLNLDSTKSNSQVTGLSFLAGDGGAAARSALEFAHDLNINRLPQLRSTEATRTAYMTALKLFPDKITSGNAFPACEGLEISWKKLKVGDSEEAFLVCGTGKVVEETCEQNPNQQKCCKDGEEWDGSQCKSNCVAPRVQSSTGACVTPVVRETAVMVDCDDAGTRPYRTLCDPDQPYTDYSPDERCGNRKTEEDCVSTIRQDRSFGFGCMGMGANSECPAGMTDAQICQNNKPWYRCTKYITGDCGPKVFLEDCQWSRYDVCVNLGPVQAMYTFRFVGRGSGSYLECKP